MVLTLVSRLHAPQPADGLMEDLVTVTTTFTSTSAYLWLWTRSVADSTLISGFAVVMAVAPAEAAAQESQVIPGKHLTSFLSYCLFELRV